jgi:Flp pilus assembly protein TadG
MIKKFLTRKHKDKPGSATSGSAAVEFAMVLPVLMALVAGALNYGLMGLQMSTLISAARGGAEYAKSNPTDSSLQTNAGTVTTLTSGTTATLVCRCTDPRLIYSVQVGTTQNTLFSLGTLSFSSLSATAKIRFD